MSLSSPASRIFTTAPLLTLPILLNLSWSALSTPNESPKWAMFVMLGVVLAGAGSALLYQRCRNGARLAPSAVGVLYLLWFAGLVLGVGPAVNTFIALERLAFWCAAGLTLTAMAWRSRHHPPHDRALQLSLIVSALVLSVDFGYRFLVDFPLPGFPRTVLFSRIGHFNFTADVLMILLPLLAWSLLTERNLWLRIGALIGLIGGGLMLLTSGSLGGMGGLAGGAVMAALLGLGSRWWHRTRRPAASGSARRGWVWLLLGLILAGALARPLYERMPANFRDQIFVRAEWWGAPKAEDLDQAQALPPLAGAWMAILPYLGARTPMWASTAGMVAEHPWVGFGTGSFEVEYPAFNKRYDLFKDPETLGFTIKTNPHNVLLQIAAENGLPMMLLFSGLYLWLLWQVMRAAWRQPDAFWLCAVWALWAAGLDTQVNHVFFNPASLFMSAIGLGLWYGRLPAPRPLAWPVCRWGRNPALPVAVTLLALFLASLPVRHLVSDYLVDRNNRMLAETPRPSYRVLKRAWEEAVAWSPQNVLAMGGLAAFYFNMGELRTAESHIEELMRAYPHYSNGLNMLASIQSRTGRLDEAEQTLEKTLKLEPDAKVVQDNLAEVRKMRERKAKDAATPAATPTVP